MEKKNDFLENYINLIASMGDSLDGFVWWSCPISSKNRFYETFTDILQGKLRFRASPYNYFKNIIRLMSYITLLLLRIVLNQQFRRGKVKRVVKRNRGQNVHLIKTFAFDSTDFSHFKDPYFKDFSDYLENRGCRVVSLCELKDAFKNSITQFNLEDGVLSYFDYIKIGDIFRCLGVIFKSFIATSRKSFSFSFEGKKIGNQFKSLYLLEHFSIWTFRAMTYYYLYKNLLSEFRVERYYYTYENNSWERMALLAFREYSPQTRLIAHLNNVVPLASANLFYGKGDEERSPQPDVVLTTGKRPKEILEKFGYYHKVQVIQACALRYGFLDALGAYQDNRREKKLLVCLEGVKQVSSIMRAIFAQADDLRDWKVVIRTHPVLPYHEIAKKVTMKIENYPHFSLSKNINLKQDLKEASVVLYWGSTVCLESIKLGRPLINIKLGDFNFDPLFELSRFKWDWFPEQSLCNVLDEIDSLHLSAYEGHLREAQAYVSGYFHPLTEENLKLFITA